MAKQYDAGMKVLVETHLPDWLALTPFKPRGRMRVIDSDVSAVTADADKVLLIQEATPWILHVELQAGYDRWLAERTAWYSALLSYKHKCPVHSMVVLLHRKADAPRLTGELVDRIADEQPHRIFRYQLVRAWELNAEALAAGTWGLFPLAPLSDTAPPILPSLVERMGRRLAREYPQQEEARTLGTIMDILLGLRYDQELTRHMMEKVMNMIDLRESHAYHIILEEGQAIGEAKGRIASLHDTLLRLGKKKFGKPSAKILRELNAITEETRLAQLSERILDVDSWRDLLAAE